MQSTVEQEVHPPPSTPCTTQSQKYVPLNARVAELQSEARKKKPYPFTN